MTITPEEIQEAVDLVREHGSMKAAERASDRSFGWIQRRVAKAEPSRVSNRKGGRDGIPDGFRLRGTSTLRDLRTGEGMLEWEKTDIDRERQWEMVQAFIQTLHEELPRVEPVPLDPRRTDENLCALYPISDHHFGMMAWGEETRGEDWDLKIAEERLAGAVKFLVDSHPVCEQAVVMVKGDFMHYDGVTAITPTSGHHLDSDTRYQKMAKVAVRSIRYAVEYAAAKHQNVHVMVQVGNHDLSSMAIMKEALSAIYEDNPRITVDTHPGHFLYYKWGRCLLGSHHGHGRQAKLPQLPLIMATDCPVWWGETDFRYFYVGHVHHDDAKDYPGCRVETLRILAPADAHAANNGYRSRQDMKGILLHTDFGEVSRILVNPEMLR